jgi:tetratricopeptide (TPR) repeat protein
MGLLDVFGFGQKRLGEGELLQALFAARRSGDSRPLTKLCRDHVEVIVAAIPRWQKPPPEVVAKPEALDEYIQTLGMVAQLLRDSGHPEFWNALVGTPEDNPISIWHAKIKEANALAKENRFEEATELLMNHLIDTRELRGNAVGNLQALSQGALGHFRFNGGKVDAALGHYEQALRMCREQSDAEGVRVYLMSLYEANRYLGKTGVAADYAKEVSQRWAEAGNQDLAKRYGRLSEITRNGEPLLRVVAHWNGKVMEVDEVDLKAAEKMEVQLVFWRNRPSLPGATNLIKQGKELGSKQQRDEALELFREAANIDPYEPDAHYQAGMALCEQRLYPQAVEEYEICEGLGPGWYFCRSDLWVAQRLALGAIPHETFLAMRFLQDGPRNAKERLNLANQWRDRVDGIPLLALLVGIALHENGRAKEAAEMWRRAIENEAEPDVRTRLLVSLSGLEEDRAKRRDLLQQAAELNGNLIASAAAALSLRSE